MQKFKFLLWALLLPLSCFAQLISIANARLQTLGATVTVKGVVLNGSEIGTVRYIWDGTGGIALYDFNYASQMLRGDSVLVTGTLISFSNLLEISPLSSFSVLNSGNALPPASLVTPLQIDDNNEAHLVRINNASFVNPTGNFVGATNYSFTANGETGVMYIRGNHPLVGMPVPTSNVNLLGIASQYGTQYQLLVRDSADVELNSFIISSPPVPQNISPNAFDLEWETNLPASSVVEYGLTPALELGSVNGAPGLTQHSVSITGLQPATFYYARVLSVNAGDTALSDVRIYITASLSSGLTKVFFTLPVDTSVMSVPGNEAIYLPSTMDDTLITYIQKADSTIDLCLYNFTTDSLSGVIAAINSAFQSGIKVRIIADGGNSNSALPLLDPAIPVLPSPQSVLYSIMHNKFMVVDAAHSNPLKPFVWTGSTNWTADQLHKDANNVVVIQDQSLAKTYVREFEEMWGSQSLSPDTIVSRFGQFKMDNTPHIFNINGKKFECYFSPSDNVNSKIIQTVNTTNYKLNFALLSFTRSDVAQAISDRIFAAQAEAYGILDDTASSTSVYNFLAPLMNYSGINGLLLYDHANEPGIMHHKYLIVDQEQNWSDPLVLTGSHNWSSTANSKNDENTLVIHDPLIANQFYQEFYKRFKENGGIMGLAPQSNVSWSLYPNPGNDQFYLNCSDRIKSIDLIDLSGKLQNSWSDINEQFFIFNAQSLAPGVYLLKTCTNQAQFYTKLVVTNR